VAIVDFSKVTVRDFLTLMKPSEEDSIDMRMFYFCDKVVVGGIMDAPLADYPAIVSQVAEKIQEY
jgi:hypothetical protein